jgi:hypothetical protein
LKWRKPELRERRLQQQRKNWARESRAKFEAQWWSYWEVVAWVCYRDASKLHDLLCGLFRRDNWYNNKEYQADQQVREAVQSRKIKAFDESGNEFKPPADLGRDPKILFKSDTIKAHWPNAGREGSTIGAIPDLTHMATELAHDNDWLKGILDWLWECRKWREEISWDAAVDRIDLSWLKQHYFGPPTVQIWALYSALVDENPRTSRPASGEKARSAFAPASKPLSKSSFKRKKYLSAHPGPTPQKRYDAVERLKAKLRNGELKEIDIGPRAHGGLTKGVIATEIRCARTELDKVMEIVLSDKEFKKFVTPWKERNEARPARAANFS